MVDDMLDLGEIMKFHPTDSPRGMLYYDMNILTNSQQNKLNTMKRNVARENEWYLANQPEIRACVALIYRAILCSTPRTNLHKTLAKYFSKPRSEIEEDVQEYMRQHPKRETEFEDIPFGKEELGVVVMPEKYTVDTLISLKSSALETITAPIDRSSENTISNTAASKTAYTNKDLGNAIWIMVENELFRRIDMAEQYQTELLEMEHARLEYDIRLLVTEMLVKVWDSDGSGGRHESPDGGIAVSISTGSQITWADDKGSAIRSENEPVVFANDFNYNTFT